jgi:phosphoribosylanthranilate isomerase
MSDIKVKICGLSTEDTMAAALEAGADMVGLMFFPKSPRHVTLSQACRLADMARGRAEIVAVTVNMDLDGLSRIRELVGPDTFQFHGEESPESLAAAKVMHGTGVIKAVPVSEAADLEQALFYSIVADRILFDAKPPEGAELPGGNGLAYDWALLKGLELKGMFGIFGGRFVAETLMPLILDLEQHYKGRRTIRPSRRRSNRSTPIIPAGRRRSILPSG